MFSGKTTELIRRLHRARGSGAVVRAIKPAGDTRSGGFLATHTGERFAAMEAGTAPEVAVAASGAAVIGIDESHFFGEPLAAVCRALRADGARVIIAGVSLDHYGVPFEPMASLAPEVDELIELTCPCAVCGKPAIHSQRMGSFTERIVVGGAGAYEARCAACFVPSRR
jgi:thymidine kinase